MRILHVLPHRGGGGETYIDLLERIPGSTHARFYLSSDRTAQSALLSLPARWPRLAIRLRSADLVHVHGDAASLIVLPLLRIRPAVITTHGLHLVRRLTGSRRSVAARLLAHAVHASRIVICTSETERRELTAIARGRDHQKLRVIHNGVDPPAPATDGARARLRTQLQVDEQTVLGLWVGQLEPVKAPLLAASAAVRARAAGAPLVLALAGDGSEAGRLNAMAGDALRVLGHRRDVDELLGAADVFVQSSEREGASFALLEAMSHALPIVATAGSGTQEAVGDAGLLVSAGDEAELSAALIRVSSDRGLRGALGSRARARAIECFDAASFLAATEAVYAQCGQPSRRHGNRRPQPRQP